MSTKEVKGFDLAALEQDDTAVIQLVHPSTGDEIGATATVYGQDSDIFRAESRKAEARYTEYSRRNRGKFMPPEDRERLDKAKVVACTKSIDGLTYKGAPLTDVEDIFNRFPWVHEQVTQGIMDRANFIKGSSAK
jgi:hypothetical protein